MSSSSTTVSLEGIGPWPIIAGRWQPFHNGHLWVSRRVIDEYGKLILAIVNPDPENPPDPDFDRFWPTANPFSYWDRYFMLSRVFAAEGTLKNVRLVPAWHPRARTEPEHYCLPPRQKRIWIVPLTSDEEEKKVQDFRARGEDVRVVHKIPRDILNVSAVSIRQMVLAGSDDWRKLVPSAIVDVAEEIEFSEKIRAAYGVGKI